MDKSKGLIKKTEKIRYKIVKLAIQKLTPSLYKKMGIMSLVGATANYRTLNFVGIVPRPSIKMMKEKFNNKLVKGAEIGVASGINTANILKELNVKELYIIDFWSNYLKYKDKYFMEKNCNLVIKRFGKDKRINIINELSENAVKNIDNNSLDFVYIDANHSYKYVYQDIENWTPKVKSGGVVAGHDVFNCYEVLEAVKDFCSKNRILFHVELPDWWFFKNG